MAKKLQMAKKNNLNQGENRSLEIWITNNLMLHFLQENQNLDSKQELK